jgi:hypothetical protein
VNEFGSTGLLRDAGFVASLMMVMRPDLAPIHARVRGLRETSAGAVASDALFAEIEDALMEGYASALSGDAWSLATEERLHALMIAPDGGEELGTLAADHARFQRQLIALRRSLSDLWRDRDRMRVQSGAARPERRPTLGLDEARANR